MSKTKLLFKLIMYVNAKRQFTAQDVAYEFNISLRTAHRYLAELSEMGVPLYTESGRNGGYRVLDNRILPPILFNEHEAFAIFFTFESLKYYQSIPFEIDIKEVSNKLYTSLTPDMKRKVDKLSSVLAFWNIKRDLPSSYLQDIIESALEKQIVQIAYFSKSQSSIKEIVPLGTYAYNGFWYIPGFDLTIGEIRLFRMDRIQSLSRLNKIYDPKITLEDWLIRQPHQEQHNPIRLYVELTREGVRQCQSQPWLVPYIVMKNEVQGYIDTTIEHNEIDFVSNYFYQLGTAAKVIEPQEMVNRICEMAEELLQNYIGRE